VTAHVAELVLEGDDGVIVLATAESIELRLPTTEWTLGTHGPAEASRFFARLDTDGLRDETLVAAIDRARAARSTPSPRPEGRALPARVGEKIARVARVDTYRRGLAARPGPSPSAERVRPHPPIESAAVAGRTQEALYSEIDLELSWSEAELPQVERTKHVHGLHPYLGKFVPQLVEIFLQRLFRPGQCVYDPFVGSGTTLVEANVFGADGVGSDISAFNCLLTNVKTTPYALGRLEMGLWATLEDSRRAGPASLEGASDWLRGWFAPRALGELLRYHQIASVRLDDPAWDVSRIILSRAARSARLTTHFDLDFPRTPTTAPYFCHKHKRTCTPVEEAEKFLRRYTVDTVRRLRRFAELRSNRRVEVLHADARTLRLPRKTAGIITSPPYPGLIDYHEQHRYSFELLGLRDRREDEIGAAVGGTSRRALAAYIADMTAVFGNAAEQLKPGAPVVIVVNDARDLYPSIVRGAGLRVEDEITRHVNRRTGRRAGEFFESILVCRIGTR